MTTENIGNGTSAGLVEYLDTIVEKGRGTPGAIQPLKTAFTKVVQEVDGTDWGKKLVAEIDIDDYVSRFGNLTRGKYSDKSLSVYKSRVNRVVGWYLKFMDQAGWMPTLSARQPRKSAVKSPKAASNPGENGDDLPGNNEKDLVIKPGMHKIELALRVDAPVTLILPRDLMATEVATITAILNSLTMNGRAEDETNQKDQS